MKVASKGSSVEDVWNWHLGDCGVARPKAAFNPETDIGAPLPLQTAQTNQMSTRHTVPSPMHELQTLVSLQ